MSRTRRILVAVALVVGLSVVADMACPVGASPVLATHRIFGLPCWCHVR